MSQDKMEDILKKIEQSADDILVPKELEPEQVKEKLLSQKKQKKHFNKRHIVEVAAAVALVAVIGGSGVYGFAMRNHGEGNPASAYSENNTESSTSQDLSSNQGSESKQDVLEDVQKEAAKKKDKVGSFRLAESYEDVYDSVNYRESQSFRDGVEGALNGGILSEEDKYTTSSDKVENEMASMDTAGSTAEKESVEHSDTNLQVEGVDESDYIKNDGNYLYLQTDNKVSIIDIRNKKIKNIAEIQPEMGADDYIVDMYVDGERAYLMLDKSETKLAKENAWKSGEEDTIIAEVDMVDVVYMDTNRCLELQTYDIKDRTNGKKIGSITLDGNYQTSRKNGDYIYLFSRKYIGDVTKKDKDLLIPKLNGEKAEANCIYVQDNATTELIAVSVNVKEPNEIADQMILLNANMELYMGAESMILYGENYEYTEDATRSSTDLIKFSYKDGYMNAVAATSVKGTIQDPFAISEKSGNLRVLTTEWSENSKNQLFLLDEDLKLLGSLQNIATGEEIYAARYIGDMAYFITYHNTDPLFAVDISDPKNPKMLGQLKVTGYSDYLHPYGENRLLGIGYETDPDSSERLGVKLTMFDTSDPKELKVIDSVVMKGTECGAARDYKCALVDVDKNLVGFDVTNYKGDSIDQKYMVYGWENDHFQKKFAQKLSCDEYWGKVRGLYAGKSFYVVESEVGGYRIRSYDMEQDFREIDEIKTY